MSQLTVEAINALHRMWGVLPSSPLFFDLHGRSPSATWLLVDKNILRRKDALWGLGLPHQLLADQETCSQKLRAHMPIANRVRRTAHTAGTCTFLVEIGCQLHICGPV